MAAEAAPSLVYLPAWRTEDELVEIAGDEAHYLARVVRARSGETVSVTDGRGALGTLEILEVGAVVRARRVRVERRARPATLALWCGAPEGDRADWLVEKAAELGVATFVPVNFRRARWERFAARRERWERLATAALRQSRSAYRLELTEPVSLAEALAMAGAVATRWVCSPDGRPLGGLPAVADGRVIGVVGPSSGFVEDELKVLSENAFDPICLGPVRLRTETAALALAAIWGAAAGAQAGPGSGMS